MTHDPKGRPDKKLALLQKEAGLRYRSLAVTDFRGGRPSTIIGAAVFHGPVRDGKGWFHCAMAARQV